MGVLAALLMGTANAATPFPTTKGPPYVVPPETKVFLGRVLAIAEHNDLKDIAFTRKALGPNIVADTDGNKDLHDASMLDFTGTGSGRQVVQGFSYYYTTVPLKPGLAFWRSPDPLFIAELGLEGVDKYRCINGLDISDVFHADPNVGMVNPRLHIFHVAQGANTETMIQVQGPVEGDQTGCVTKLIIFEHKLSDFIPPGSIQ
jgi:hypothetical protein